MTFTATTALPYPHLGRATAGLRGELRQQLLAAGVVAAPDWSTLAVTGPQEFADERGQVWFGYWATLDATPERSMGADQQPG
ncbi:MAG: hypothetical protein JWO67_2186 [Streptosporangiaceae bacterium]|nr:hypothetical protein [Streptosporangiaceae bacterium]